MGQGSLIEDQSLFQQLNCLHHKWMSPLQFRELCNESFELSGGSSHGADLNAGDYAFVSVPAGTEKRIQMPFLTLGAFQQPRYLPGRFLNFVLEIELTPDAESWINTIPK